MRDLERYAKWLGITYQQCRILETVLAVRKRSEVASPKRIMRTESELHGTPPIQRSNFFRQMKALQDKGYVKRLSNASYDLDFESIRRALKDSMGEALDEAGELDKALYGVEDYFSAHMTGLEETEAAFLSYEQQQERFADMLAGSGACYITGLFPKMLYGHSRVFVKLQSGRRYANTLWERCVEKKDLEVTYLTRLDVDYLVKRLLDACGDPVIACDEADSIMKTLERLLATNENLRMFYSSSPYGIDIGIPDVERLREFFLFFRNRRKEGIGAVCLGSPELTLQFKSLFQRECRESVDLRSVKGERALGRAKTKLKTMRKRLC